MITVNRRAMTIPAELSVEELLERCNYSYPMIVVRINGKVIQPGDYKTAMVRDGDSIEAIHLVAGG